MKALFIASLLACSTLASANELFVITKNRTPKNILHYKANVVNCEFAKTPVTPYWILGEERGQTEAITNSEKGMFQPKVTYQKATEVDFSIGAMERLGNSLPNKKISVRIENCQAKAYLEVKGQEMELKEIYAQIKLLSISSLTLSGFAPNGSKISHKIEN